MTIVLLSITDIEVRGGHLDMIALFMKANILKVLVIYNYLSTVSCQQEKWKGKWEKIKRWDKKQRLKSKVKENEKKQ